MDETAPHDSDMISVIINGKTTLISPNTTLIDLVRIIDLPPIGVAIAVNSEIITKSKWNSTLLLVDQQVEIVSIAAGG